MADGETTKIELGDVRQENGDSTKHASTHPSGPLLTKQSCPTNGGTSGQTTTDHGTGGAHERLTSPETSTTDNQRNGGRHRGEKGACSNRRMRIYMIVCIAAIIVSVFVFMLLLGLQLRDHMRKAKESDMSDITTKPTTTTTTTDPPSGEDSTDRNQYQNTGRPDIDEISALLSVTFPTRTYIDAYADPMSREYNTIEKNFTQDMEFVFQNGEFSNIYDKTTIQDVRAGSVVIDCTIHLAGVSEDMREIVAAEGRSGSNFAIGWKIRDEVANEYPGDEDVVVRLNQVVFRSGSYTTPVTTIAENEPTLTTIEPAPSCFQCTSSPDCLPMSWVCDGDSDCDEDEDELHCPCDDGYLCNNGLCIIPSYRCDGLPDCKNGDDEMNCSCNETTEYTCANSRACIPVTSLCDLTPDCLHHDDESEEECDFASITTVKNISTGHSQIITLPAPLQKGNYLGPGAYALWLISSPGDAVDLLVEVSLTIQQDDLGAAAPRSYVKFGRGDNVTRAPIAAFRDGYATTPAGTNPFYARSSQLWVVLYQVDGTVVDGLINITAVPAQVCTGGEEACQYSPECIPPGGRCDGNQDCTFTGEDENLCLFPDAPLSIRNESDFTDMSSSSYSSSFFINDDDGS